MRTRFDWTSIFAGILLILAIGIGMAQSGDEPSALAARSARLLQMLPAETVAVIGLDANPRGCPEVFDCFSNEILFAAGLKERLRPFKPLIQAIAPEKGVLLAWTGPPEEGGGWAAMIPSALQEGWLPAARQAGFSDSAQPDGSVWLTPNVPSDASLLAAALPDLLLMGEASAVRRCLDQKGSPNPGLAGEADFRRRVEDLASRSHVWGVARRQWLDGDLSSQQVSALPQGFLLKSLSGVRWVDFSARIDFQIEFRMRTEAEDEGQARILADELSEFIAQAAPPNAPQEVRQTMQDAQVTTDGRNVELSMQISADAMSRIQENQASRAILRWRLGAAQREANQRIADLLKWMEVKPGSRTADIGAGTGFTAVRLARLAGPQGVVHAVEIQPDLVEHLQQRSERAGLGQLKAVLGAEDNPHLPVNALDSALIVNAYHEMERYQDMLRHIHRSLRPGGRLVITEPFAPAHSGDSRASQIGKHQIAPQYAQQELEEAGFEILHREDGFIVRDHEGHDHRDWLIVAIKGEAAEGEARGKGSPKSKNQDTAPIWLDMHMHAHLSWQYENDGRNPRRAEGAIAPIGG